MAELIYNNYSEGNQPKVLKPGQVARFRVLGSEKRLQTDLHLPYEDYVWDEGHQNMISIGAIKRLKAEGKPEFYLIHLNENQQKCWTLLGSRKADREIYRFLQKANFNKSNQSRDDENEALIEEYDSTSLIKRKKKNMDKKRAAVNAAAAMSEKEVRDYYGGNQLADIDGLRIDIEKEAKESPEKFTQKVDSKEEIDIKSYVQKAVGKNIIKHDAEMNQWLDSDGNVLLNCSKGIGSGKYVDFVNWVESGEGKDMMDIILEKLS
jgi:hypothetical protein